MKTAPNPKKTFISNINFYEKFFLAFFSAILILESYFQMIEKKKNFVFTYRLSNIVDRVTSNQIFIIIIIIIRHI